jgi:hypothetical protein
VLRWCEGKYRIWSDGPKGLKFRSRLVFKGVVGFSLALSPSKNVVTYAPGDTVKGR